MKNTKAVINHVMLRCHTYSSLNFEHAVAHVWPSVVV